MYCQSKHYAFIYRGFWFYICIIFKLSANVMPFLSPIWSDPSPERIVWLASQVIPLQLEKAHPTQPDNIHCVFLWKSRSHENWRGHSVIFKSIYFYLRCTKRSQLTLLYRVAYSETGTSARAVLSFKIIGYSAALCSCWYTISLTV